MYSTRVLEYSNKLYVINILRFTETHELTCLKVLSLIGQLWSKAAAAVGNHRAAEHDLVQLYSTIYTVRLSRTKLGTLLSLVLGGIIENQNSDFVKA
jgi:hypothetical protein